MRLKRRKWGLRNKTTNDVVKVMNGDSVHVAMQKLRPGHSWILLPDGFDQTQHQINGQGQIMTNYENGNPKEYAL